jgi:polyribonucleotide nucleotidyltransferase
MDYFPLTCDYRERQAAAGNFRWLSQREGRPTTKETLTARLIDRPIGRCLRRLQRRSQIQNFVMSSDRQTDGDVLAMNGACRVGFRRCRSWDRLAAVRLGLVDGEFVPFPTQLDLETSELDDYLRHARGGADD